LGRNGGWFQKEGASMADIFHTSVITRLAAAAMLVLSACASSDSTTYSSRDVGQVIESSRGRVLASRPVDVASEGQSGLGAATGGVVGGIAGSTIGKGKGQSLATAAGILVGVLVGSLIEQEMRSGQGTEYTVEMDDGRVVTIVQNQKSGEAPIPDGQEVAVQYGADYTRITPIDSAYPPSRTASASGASGYPSDYPASYAASDPASDPGSAGSSPYPSDYPPATPPSGGGATGGAGAPVRPGDSEWRNPDLEAGGTNASTESSGTYEPDPGGAPIFVPGPSNAN
jgi:outer membrane lipoprotein SlyB